MGIIYTDEISSTECSHVASLNSPCQGPDQTHGLFNYKTTSSFVTPNICNYTCEDTDYYNQYSSTYTLGSLIYTFSTASNIAYAPSLNLFNNPLTWTTTSPQILTETKTPTATPVNYFTIYDYTRQNLTVEVDFINTLPSGYG
jgi:hypothetical protein